MKKENLEKMTGRELMAVADSLNVKVATNKERTGLKESKSKVIEKIVAALPKEEKKVRKHKEISTEISELLTFLAKDWEDRGGYIRKGNKEDAKFAALCFGKNSRQVAKLMWTNTKISLYVRIESAIEFSEKNQKINYGLPFQCMYFHNTKETRNNIKKVFDIVTTEDIKTKKRAE